MSDISDVLSEGEIFTKRNENIDDDIKIKLGDLFDKKNPEKIQPTGLRHLIKHRMEERLNNGLSMEDSQRETAAILFLAVNNIDKAPAIIAPSIFKISKNIFFFIFFSSVIYRKNNLFPLSALRFL